MIVVLCADGIDTKLAKKVAQWLRPYGYVELYVVHADR